MFSRRSAVVGKARRANLPELSNLREVFACHTCLLAAT
jgi:hypothetical protein